MLIAFERSRDPHPRWRPNRIRTDNRKAPTNWRGFFPSGRRKSPRIASLLFAWSGLTRSARTWSASDPKRTCNVLAPSVTSTRFSLSSFGISLRLSPAFWPTPLSALCLLLAEDGAKSNSGLSLPMASKPALAQAPFAAIMTAPLAATQSNQCAPQLPGEARRRHSRSHSFTTNGFRT